jgi:hypothetical protein
MARRQKPSLADYLPPEDMRQMLARIEQAIERFEAILKAFSMWGEAEPPKPPRH